MKETAFCIVIDKIFSIKGTCSHSFCAGGRFQLFFDFPIGSFSSPCAKTCRIEIKSDQNVMFHFLDTYKFPVTPSIKEIDEFLREQKAILTNWVDKKWYEKHPSTFLQNLLKWMFFFTIRRIFDFTWALWIEEKKAKHLEELYSLQPNEFHFWELITNIISKVWFFRLIIELKMKTKGYVSILNDLIEHKKLDVERNPLIDQILNELEKHDMDLGLPIYASEGEVVILRKFEENEIYKGFVDRSQKWFIALENVLKKYGYILTYQDPYGIEIDHFPIEVCLSFKSEKFKGDGMPVFFTPKFDSIFKNQDKPK